MKAVGALLKRALVQSSTGHRYVSAANTGLPAGVASSVICRSMAENKARTRRQ